MKRPVLVILVYYTVGILTGRYFGITGTALVLIGAFIISLVLFKLKDDKTAFAALLALAAGAILTANIIGTDSCVFDGDITAEGVIYDISYSKSGRQRLDIHTYTVNGKDENINIRVMADKDYNADIGDCILAAGRAEMPSEAYNPGGFDDELYMKRESIAFRLYAERVYKTGTKPMPVRNVFYKARNILNESIDSIYAPDDAALIKAVVTGDKSGISDEQRKLYTDGGAVHVLCVSGLHTGVIAAVMMFICVRFFRLKGKILAAAVTAGLLAYMLFTGCGPSVVRAVIMAVIALWALPLGRKSDGFNNIFLAALVILLFSPLTLFNPGFLLSFATVFGIVLSAKYITVRGRGIYVKRLILSSFYAIVFSLPITAYCFYDVSVAGIITNLIILPLTPALVILGIISAVTGLMSVPIGVFFGGVPFIVLRLYEFILKAASAIPFFNILTGRPSLPMCALFYAAVILLTVNAKNRVRLKKLSAVCFAAVLLITAYNGIFRKNIDITYLYVGQGDCTVITDYRKNVVVIDTGGSAFYGENDNTGRRYIYPYLQYKGIEDIEMLFITHPDIDHSLGSLELMDVCGIKTIVLSDYGFEDNELYDKIVKKAEEKNINIEYMSAGDTIVCGDMEIDCMYPFKGNSGENNAGSLLLKLRYGDFSAIFTGDLGTQEEKSIISAGMDVDSDILKLGHHGSKYSSSEEFIEAVSPEYAVISAGKNNIYGHPDKSVIERLRDTEYFITYETGAVTVTTDGYGYSVKTMR